MTGSSIAATVSSTGWSTWVAIISEITSSCVAGGAVSSFNGVSVLGILFNNTSNEFDCWTGKENGSLLIDDKSVCLVLFVAMVVNVLSELDLLLLNENKLLLGVDNDTTPLLGFSLLRSDSLLNAVIKELLSIGKTILELLFHYLLMMIYLNYYTP